MWPQSQSVRGSGVSFPLSPLAVRSNSTIPKFRRGEYGLVFLLCTKHKISTQNLTQHCNQRGSCKGMQTVQCLSSITAFSSSENFLFFCITNNLAITFIKTNFSVYFFTTAMAIQMSKPLLPFSGLHQLIRHFYF